MIITAGKLKGRKIAAPGSPGTRPTLSKVRMAVFNTLGAMTDFEGKSFLDMYAGTGIMGLEALSRGFARVVFVEKNPKSFKLLQNNICHAELVSASDPILEGVRSRNEFGMTEAICANSLKITPKLGEFDVAYIDPPYEAGIYEQSLAVVQAKIIVVEHMKEFEHYGFTMLKQKRYGNKFVTFLQAI